MSRFQRSIARSCGAAADAVVLPPVVVQAESTSASAASSSGAARWIVRRAWFISFLGKRGDFGRWQRAARQHGRLLEGAALQRAQAPEAFAVGVGHVARLLRVLDHGRRDQHEQLGTLLVQAGAAEQPADDRDLAEARYAILVPLLGVVDQATEQHRLAALHRDLGLD